MDIVNNNRNWYHSSKFSHYYMKLLPLYKHETIIGHSKVDDDMFDYLNQWKWTINCGYVTRVIKHPNGKPKKQLSLRIHRVIMNTPTNLVTDHINGDRLDNRKSNLRICTQKENSRNMTVVNNKFGYKGLSRNGKDRYMAQIRVNRKLIYLGNFKTQLEAARAYDMAAIKHFGNFASLNGV